jgi:hypothetical protein
MHYRVTKEKNDSGTFHRYVFDSVASFARQAEDTSHKATHSSSKSEDDDWAGGSFKQATDMIDTGWPEGREKMGASLAEVSTTPTMMASLAMDVAGAYPIAALAAAGDPCAMVDLQPIEDRVRPIVRLVVGRVASALYSAKEFMNYGVAVLSYVEGLEAAGFRVEIEANMACMMDNRIKVDCRVTLKKAEEPIEMDKLAYALAHPTFLRRICFRVWESIPEIDAILGWGYGSPRSLEPCEIEHNQIVLPGINVLESKHLKTAQEALKAVAPVIEKQMKNAGLAPPPIVFAGNAKA